MIELVGNALYQWDTGRRVQITGVEADEVHLANQGDSKAPIMDIADSQAKIPDYLLQTGKALCAYAVKDGITVESRTFHVHKRERPENYIYEDDQRNYIYALITNAEAAIEDANKAAASANQAAGDANKAAASVNRAVESANASANSATLAAKSANEAADKAKHTAKSLMVVGGAAGNSIYLDDAIDQFLVGLRVFGKTTQDGTPTPEVPVDLVSVESPAVTVNDQTLLIPYTLHGIPVSSGGNYTDANGQQWICDEIDLGRGVHIQRTFEYVCTGNEAWVVSGNQFVEGSIRYDGSIVIAYKGTGSTSVLCSHFPYNGANVLGAWVYKQTGLTLHMRIQVENAVFASVNELVAFLKNQYANGTPIKYLCVLETPIETPLSEEELAAFAALRTYRGNTTVSNDASAHMEIEYVMDAKKYIDSVISGINFAARVASVSLPASKWTGSGNLYSQVVSISGVTENSQVNLAPSVEQLSIFYEKDITFVTENEGGVVTVYVIGQKPQNDYTIQADIVEVIT